jgi:hypothetical protein
MGGNNSVPYDEGMYRCKTCNRTSMWHLRKADKNSKLQYDNRRMGIRRLGFMRGDSETKHNANMRRRERDAERDNKLQYSECDMERGGVGDMRM